MDFGLASFQELQDFYPEIIDEITGFAQGVHALTEEVAGFLLSLGIFETTGQCSVFAFQSRSSVIVGRNYDMLLALKKFTEASLVAPQNKYAYLSHSDVFIGRSDGLNECGLFIAVAFVNGTTTQPGIGFHILIRKILEECSNTQQAVQLIQQTKVASANNFLIADRQGTLAVVEAAPQKKVLRYPLPRQKFIYITNQFVSPDMQAIDQGGITWSKSQERFQVLQKKLVSTNQLDLHTAKTILADPCVCLDLKKQKFGTIWSWVADLNMHRIERAETKPKVTNFKTDSRLEWWLNKRIKNTRTTV